VLPFVVCGVGEEGKRKRDLVIIILPIACPLDVGVERMENEK